MSKRIEAGKLLSIETGEYGDHIVRGFFVALSEFDVAAELTVYLEELPGQKKEYHGSHAAFLAWLITRGRLLEIDYTPVHIGIYSTLEIT